MRGRTAPIGGKPSSDAGGWLHPHFIVRERPYHTHLNRCIHVPIIVVMQMPNPGQPTIASGATGDAVRRLQRALRRTPIPGLAVDGVFGPTTEVAVRDFQQAASLAVDGVVGPLTWAALPDGRPMPTLEEGSIGAVVRSLQEVLLNGASGQWYTAPGAFDGEFGPYTKVSVQAFQTWGGVKADGVVGDQTWAVSLHAASTTLETAVGLQFVIG